MYESLCQVMRGGYAVFTHKNSNQGVPTLFSLTQTF